MLNQLIDKEYGADRPVSTVGRQVTVGMVESPPAARSRQIQVLAEKPKGTDLLINNCREGMPLVFPPLLLVRFTTC